MRNVLKLLALLLSVAPALAGEVGNYPNAAPLNGSERWLMDQGGPAGPSLSGTTVNATSQQISAYLFPNGYLPATLFPSLTGDCTTSAGSFSITCTKSQGVAFSTLATAPTSAAIVNLFAGCTAQYYLGADGACHNPAGTGTVTSVSLTAPSWLTVGGSPVTTAGTLSLTSASVTSNQFLAAPNGSAGALTPRAIVAADLPPIPASGVTGVLSPLNGGSGEAGAVSGVLKANAASPYSAAGSTDVISLWSGACSSTTFLRGDGACTTPPGQGTVTSVGIAMPSVFAVTNSPVTQTGNLNVTFAPAQTPNAFLASPNNTIGAVSLRAIVGNDLPPIALGSASVGVNGGTAGILGAGSGGSGEGGTVTGILYAAGTAAYAAATSTNVINLWTGGGTCSSATYLRGDGQCQAPTGSGSVTSVGLTTPSWLTVSGSPITAAGTLAVSGTTQTGNLVLASPDGSAGPVTPRALVAADIPVISASTQLSGTLQAAQFPALTGDATTTAGSLAVTVGKVNGTVIPASATVLGSNSSHVIVAATTSGSGSTVALTTSPSFTTPTLGVATATSINGNSFTPGTYTLAGSAGKTLDFTNTLTLSGTDSTIQTFPATSANLAGTNVVQAWTANQTFKNGGFALSGTGSGYTLLNSSLTGPGNNTMLLPATASDTLAALGTAETWSAAQTFSNGDLLLAGSTSGTVTLEAPATAGSSVITFPATTDTVDVLGTAQTFTAAKTFTNSDLKLLGSSTGATTFTSANASATNYTATVPANSGTLSELNATETWTAPQTFTNSDFLLLGSSTGATTFTSANSSATGYTLTFPAITDTVVTLTAAQTLTNKTLTTPVLGVASGTSLVLGSPTGGAEGTGTLNATGIYINGVSVNASSGAFTTTTASETATAGNCSILANAANNNVTITLPTAVSASFTCIVKRIDNSTHSVTIATTSAQTIDGQTTLGILNQYTAVSMKSDGSNWWIF